jgi:HTH-type transcriptional regulator, transcriptional repressor of NAD biosynthesis genes
MNTPVLICLYGPESTGKSEMAKKLAVHYQTDFVPEVARERIDSNNFTTEDIIEIGRTQTERVVEKVKSANKILFCDTDLITTQIYSHHYLNIVPPVLYQLEGKVKYDHYFLFDVDVPWVADHLRDLGEKRTEMSEIFKSELQKRNISFTLVQGNWAQREEIIVKTLKEKFDL